MLPNNQEAKINNNTDSLKLYLQIIEWFGSLAGLKLNKKNTKAMWIGCYDWLSCVIAVIT